MPDKEGLPKLMESLKVWFAALVVLLGVLSLVTFYKDMFPEWKKYQNEFFKREAARGQGGSHVVEVKQIWQADLKQNGVQRCITCHVALADPDVPNDYTDNPYKNPSLDVHKIHKPINFGCTVCHGGQGQGTTVLQAHGHVEHWNWPMLGLEQGENGQPSKFDKDYIESSCFRCHVHESAPKGT